jgi:nucleotide-binding universal stress UspA family protein
MSATSFKTIFLPVAARDDGGIPASVHFAIELARSQSAHLDAFAIAMRFGAPTSFAQGFVDSIVGGANKEERAKAEKLESVARDMLAKGEIEGSVRLVQEHSEALVPLVVSTARTSDISILSVANDLLLQGRMLIEEALFHSGHPIIVVPEETSSFSCRRVMICWDGSQRAARAIHDALPLLTESESVDVVMVTKESKTKPPAGSDALSRYLARHGVEAKTVVLEAPGGDAAKAIDAYAREKKTDFIVMGAYAHSWFRQMVFGGVTESMLEKPPAPVLMSF